MENIKLKKCEAWTPHILKNSFFLFPLLVFFVPQTYVCARGLYFSGTSTLIPGRYSFTDASGHNAITNSLNIDVTALAKPTDTARLQIRAFTDKKTIITPYRESLLGIKFSNTNLLFFDKPVNWSIDCNAQSYDDKTDPMRDFTGFSTRYSSWYQVSKKTDFRFIYGINRHLVKNSQNSFWHHTFDLKNTYRINRDMSVISEGSYIRNKTISSIEDFNEKKFKSEFLQTLPWNHRWSGKLSTSSIDYHNNPTLEKDTVKCAGEYIIPLTDREHICGLSWDMRYFPEASSNSFHDITGTYQQTHKADIHHGIRKHDVRLSYCTGKTSVNDYIDGDWQYKLETAGFGPRKYYFKNEAKGRFYRNDTSSVPLLQHYIEELLHSGIIVSRYAGGIISAGPIIGTRQTIDPQARFNSHTYDNVMYKNPLSSIIYGGEARTDVSLDPSTDILFMLKYLNYYLYNTDMSTEFITLYSEITHQWARRIKAQAEISYNQNINDTGPDRPTNTIFTILFKIIYSFDTVIL